MPDRRPLVNGGAQVREIPNGDALLVPSLKALDGAGSDVGQPEWSAAGALVRRQYGAAGRWFTSQYGSGSSAGQWTKLCTVSIVNGYNFVQFEIAITQGYTGRGGMRAIVSLAAAPTTGLQTIQVRCIASDKASSRLVAVRTKNYPTDGANEIELWWQTDSNWLNVAWSFSNLLVDTNCTMTPTPSGGGWVASPSAGTQYPAWSAWMADQLNLSSLTPNTLTGTDANDNLVSYSASAARALIDAAAAPDVNLGTTYEGTSDPFHQTQRFSAFDKRGGARTWNGIGPFAGTKEWYNVVDVMHRNGTGDGASGYGGILAWGMVNFKTRMAFGSRAADGSYSWTEVATVPYVATVWSAHEGAGSGWFKLGTISLTSSSSSVQVQADVFGADQSGNSDDLTSVYRATFLLYHSTAMSNTLEKARVRVSGWEGYPVDLAETSAAIVVETNTSSEKRLGLWLRSPMGGISVRCRSIATGSGVASLSSAMSAGTPSSPTYGTLRYQSIRARLLEQWLPEPASSNSDGSGFVDVDGTYVLPTPYRGRILTLNAAHNFGAMITCRFEVPTGVTVEYRNSQTGANVTMTAGQTLSIHGRTVQLFGASATNWRMLGAF